MNYQNVQLPAGAVQVGATPRMTQETVAPGILQNHRAPRDKYGYLVVELGTLQFVWEDDPENVLDADAEHPIVIEPERAHHVRINGAVTFHVEFYTFPSGQSEPAADDLDRPGESFV